MALPIHLLDVVERTEPVDFTPGPTILLDHPLITVSTGRPVLTAPPNGCTSRNGRIDSHAQLPFDHHRLTALRTPGELA